MTLIRKKIEILGTKGKKEINVLFDSGSSRSLIREDIAREISKMIEYPRPDKFRAINETIIEAKKSTPLAFDLNGCSLAHDFKVIDNLDEEAVIGADLMQLKKIKIDMEKEYIDTSQCEIYNRL